MNEFETYVAIIKGYCGAVILFCPKAFANGGYGFGTFCLLASGIFTLICARKLIECGQKYDCFSYSLIVKKAYGKWGKAFLDLMVGVSQFSFTITMIVFIT